MKIITATKLATGKKKLGVTSAADVGTLISESTVVRDHTGAPIIVYQEMSGTVLDTLAAHLRGIHYDKGARTSGLPSISRVFGFQPRIAIRRDFCASASLNRERAAYLAILKGGAMAADVYRAKNPDLFQQHVALTRRVLPEYRLDESLPFTSGIVNKNNQLRYHHDAGNFKNVWSAMFVFKKDCEGGYLSCPEYGLGFELKNNALLLFDGQSILHGVTPFRLLSPSAYRLSIVYYSLAGLWKCLPPDEELARIRQVKTGREKRRAQKA